MEMEGMRKGVYMHCFVVDDVECGGFLAQV